MRGWRVAVVGLAAVACGCGEGVQRVEIGQPVPAYGAVDLQGDSVHLSDLRGEVVLLNVWATWCEPCREEIPALQALHERLSPRGFQVVGVSIDVASERDNLKPFGDSFGITYPVWHDTQDAVLRRFLIVGPPATILIDREGVMRWRHTGPVAEDDPALLAAIEAALGEGES